MSVGRAVRVGITGHQSLTDATTVLIRKELLARLRRHVPTRGLTSLAAGADQIFAGIILELGGELAVVLPCDQYEAAFQNPDDLARFHQLLQLAIDVTRLPYAEPSERAYWAAGREIVDRSDVLLAVWDGRPAAGLGGTADVVAYARQRKRPVEIIWPVGAARSL